MYVDDFIINALGLVGTAFSICMWAPQARITWQNRNDPARLAGVSETTQWLLLIGYLIWGVYGVLSGSIWITMPSIVASPLALATIIVVRRGRRMPMTVSVPIISADETHSNLDETHSVPEAGPVESTNTASIPVILSQEPLTEFDMTASIPVIASEPEAVSLTTGTIPILASEPVEASNAVTAVVSTDTDTLSLRL